MSGSIPDLPALAAVCRAEGATLYVDDAHGFGVIGERGPGETCPYGMRGNCVVRHTGGSYDGIVLVGGGIYVTLAGYPLVPRDRVGFRIQLTVLTSDDDIDRLNGTLTRLSERFPLRLKG
ncbi:hypothetical protein [Streptomyces azureus]|uniref:8-amino-7-oxononanoate synthase n=1 Tax=Streptomyces azureus TaxID=146537 RepID=A0A0K8PFI0_STRAJ|nr:hypothetical protein [Streptomyces azureus]GAP46478.1 8-amino-7-oxononanoate synthase [Streptomyces azureus]